MYVHILCDFIVIRGADRSTFYAALDRAAVKDPIPLLECHLLA